VLIKKKFGILNDHSKAQGPSIVIEEVEEENALSPKIFQNENSPTTSMESDLSLGELADEKSKSQITNQEGGLSSLQSHSASEISM
jgi:hypothetical protein